jgi:hypothetical protein
MHATVNVFQTLCSVLCKVLLSLLVFSSGFNSPFYACLLTSFCYDVRSDSLFSGYLSVLFFSGAIYLVRIYNPSTLWKLNSDLQGHVGHSGISAHCDLHLNMKLADLDLTKCVPSRFCLCNVTIFSAFSFIVAWSGLVWSFIVWVPGVFNLFFYPSQESLFAADT